MEGYVFFIPEAAEDRLLDSLRRVFTDRPDTAVGVTADDVIDIEFDCPRRDHVEEILDLGFLRG